MHELKIDHGATAISRRQFAQSVVASAGVFVVGPALAQVPQPVLGTTAESPMGPFYPLHRWPRMTPILPAWPVMQGVRRAV